MLTGAGTFLSIPLMESLSSCSYFQMDVQIVSPESCGVDLVSEGLDSPPLSSQHVWDRGRQVSTGFMNSAILKKKGLVSAWWRHRERGREAAFFPADCWTGVHFTSMLDWSPLHVRNPSRPLALRGSLSGHTIGEKMEARIKLLISPVCRHAAILSSCFLNVFLKWFHGLHHQP